MKLLSARRGASFSCLLAMVACIALGASPAAQAQAQTQPYPSKPIQIVLGFPPGGSTDTLARLVAEGLQRAWGQTVLVVNKPGANTIIATDFVAKSPADGYTLVVGASSGFTINPALYPKLPYVPLRDLTPITVMGSFPLVMTVPSSVPARSVKEFIDYAKSNTKAMNYSSGSTLFQVAAEMFKQTTSTNIMNVPYKGSAQALMALTAGDVTMTFLDPSPLLPHIKSGAIRALAVTSGKRWTLLPEVPTMAESGVPDYAFSSWIALFAPAGTPPEIVRRLNAEVNRIMALPETRSKLEAMAIDPGARALGVEAGDNSPERLTAIINEEAARFGAVIKTADIKAD